MTTVVYRADSGYTPPRGTTIADVLTHEIEELGNTGIVVNQAVLDQLARCPASACLWVSPTYAYARQFGAQVDRLELTHLVVIATDPYGGMLIWLGLNKALFARG